MWNSRPWTTYAWVLIILSLTLAKRIPEEKWLNMSVGAQGYLCTTAKSHGCAELGGHRSSPRPDLGSEKLGKFRCRSSQYFSYMFTCDLSWELPLESSKGKKKKQSQCHLSFSSGCRTCVQERKTELVSAKLQDNRQGYAGNEKAWFFAPGGSLDRRCQRSLTTLFLFPECCSASRGRRDLLSHSKE